MRKKTVFIYIVVLLMIIATTCIYILKNEKDTGKEIIISKESTKDYVLEKVKSGFVTYNGTELISYDTDMEQKWVIAIEEEEADLFSNEDYILLANPESDELYLVKDGTLIHNIETGKKLRAASVNENGYICALTSDKGYKGQCIVYGKKGEVLAEYSFGEKYILGAYLMKDNRTLVFNVVEDTSAGYAGKIIYSDIKSGKEKKEIVSDGIFSYIKVYENKVFLSEDGTFYCYDKNGKEKWSYSYDSGEPLYIAFSEGYVSMVIKSAEAFRGCEVLTFNFGGRLKGKYETDSHITAFDAHKGFSSFIVNGELFLLNKHGKVVGVSETSGDIEKIKLFKDEGKVLLLSDKAVMKKISR